MGNRCKQGIVRDDKWFNAQQEAGFNESVKTFLNATTQSHFCNNECPDREKCTSDCKCRILENFQKEMSKMVN